MYQFYGGFPSGLIPTACNEESRERLMRQCKPLDYLPTVFANFRTCGEPPRILPIFAWLHKLDKKPTSQLSFFRTESIDPFIGESSERSLLIRADNYSSPFMS